METGPWRLSVFLCLFLLLLGVVSFSNFCRFLALLDNLLLIFFVLCLTASSHVICIFFRKFSPFFYELCYHFLSWIIIIVFFFFCWIVFTLLFPSSLTQHVRAIISRLFCIICSVPLWCTTLSCCFYLLLPLWRELNASPLIIFILPLSLQFSHLLLRVLFVNIILTPSTPPFYGCSHLLFPYFHTPPCHYYSSL